MLYSKDIATPAHLLRDAKDRGVITPLLIDLIAKGDGPSRNKAGRVQVQRLVIKGLVIQAFVASSKGSDPDYLVVINLLERKQSCDCHRFMHGEGSCKHVIKVAAEALACVDSRTNAVGWIEDAVEESRNAYLQKMPWEEKPSFTDEVAHAYNATVATVNIGRRDVVGYMTAEYAPKIWTGPLPLPKPGEFMIAHLPNRERVPCKVVGFDDSSRYYLSCVVEFLDGDRKSHRLSLFGGELIRTEDQIDHAKRDRAHVK